MDINALLKIANKPELYAKGNSFMWTDSHISKHLLQLHLNKEIDLASRKEIAILKTTNWILSQTNKKQLDILDLGCGPGLYTGIFAESGHNVTGIDVSAESINYARITAEKDKLPINYINRSYLGSDFGQKQYDLIIMIYTDFGVLTPSEREQLLKNVRKALKDDGVFIFDVLNDSSFSKNNPEQSWECETSGFWSDKPYLHLSKSYIYEKEKVVLYQHIVVDESENLKTYHFWTHFFSEDDLQTILIRNGFTVSSKNQHVLPASDIWKGNNVTFIVCYPN